MSTALLSILSHFSTPPTDPRARHHKGRCSDGDARPAVSRPSGVNKCGFIYAIISLQRTLPTYALEHTLTDSHPMHDQELVAAVGRSAGIVLMSPPADSAEARTSLAALTSAIKPKTKVRGDVGELPSVWIGSIILTFEYVNAL